MYGVTVLSSRHRGSRRRFRGWGWAPWSPSSDDARRGSEAGRLDGRAGAARRFGVSQAIYRELEAGTRSPAWETFDRICKLFGWPLDLQRLPELENGLTPGAAAKGGSPVSAARERRRTDASIDGGASLRAEKRSTFSRSVVAVIAVALLSGTMAGSAEARSLRIRYDGNDSPIRTDIRRVVSDLSPSTMFLRIDAWQTFHRWDGVFHRPIRFERRRGLRSSARNLSGTSAVHLPARGGRTRRGSRGHRGSASCDASKRTGGRVHDPTLVVPPHPAGSSLLRPRSWDQEGPSAEHGPVSLAVVGADPADWTASGRNLPRIPSVTV